MRTNYHCIGYGSGKIGLQNTVFWVFVEWILIFNLQRKKAMFISKQIGFNIHTALNKTFVGFESPCPSWLERKRVNDFKNRLYYITDPFIEASNVLISQIKKTKNADIVNGWVKNKEDFKICLIFEKIPFLFEKIGMKIFIFVAIGEVGYLNTVDFNKINDIGMPSSFVQLSTLIQNNEQRKIVVDLNTAMLSMIPLLVFMDYAEVQEKIVKAGTKNRGISKKSGDSNLSDFNVIRLDSTYFTRIYREEGFSVSGHFRLQSYGEGLKYRKLIYINPFEKTGYTRRAKIEME